MRTAVPQRHRGPEPTPSSRRCCRRKSKPSRLGSPTGPVRHRRQHAAHPSRPFHGRLLSQDRVCQQCCLAACTRQCRSADNVRTNAGKKDKGLTLEEVETAEGGVVRESAVGMAQTKRAARRKGKQAAVVGASPAARF